MTFNPERVHVEARPGCPESVPLLTLLLFSWPHSSGSVALRGTAASPHSWVTKCELLGWGWGVGRGGVHKACPVDLGNPSDPQVHVPLINVTLPSGNRMVKHYVKGN